MLWRKISNNLTRGHHLKRPAPTCAHDFCKGVDPIYRPRVLDRRPSRCGLPRKLIGNRESPCPNVQIALSLTYGVEVPQGFRAPKVYVQDGSEDSHVIVLVPLDSETPLMHGRF